VRDEVWDQGHAETGLCHFTHGIWVIDAKRPVD
jgi:hypothetical protein